MYPQYEFTYVLEEAAAIIPSMFSSASSSVLGVVSYVFSALALYTIAKRRGLNNPWLSWVPVVNCWILGSLSDQYRYVVKGENRSKRKVLIVLNIISAVLTSVLLGIFVGLVVNAVRVATQGAVEREILNAVVGPALGMAGVAIPLAGVAIAFTVIRFMALYDVYTSCDPSNSVLFTVLSILIGVTEPFFLFFSRNKDKGMPPRREQPVYEAPVYEAPVYEAPVYEAPVDEVPAEESGEDVPLVEEPQDPDQL